MKQESPTTYAIRLIREDERAKIAAWLRERGQEDLADAIERGECDVSNPEGE